MEFQFVLLTFIAGRISMDPTSSVEHQHRRPGGAEWILCLIDPEIKFCVIVKCAYRDDFLVDLSNRASILEVKVGSVFWKISLEKHFVDPLAHAFNVGSRWHLTKVDR